MTIIKRVFIAALLLIFVHLNVSYWQDPIFWRRWWDLVTHLDPAYMNYKPVETVASTEPFIIPEAKQSTIAAGALDQAQAYAREFDSFALLVIHRVKFSASGITRAGIVIV
ncbi:hypothetical protein [Oceanicoccus sp. KOV_DT_Chl]|uniref:hypothetical protein n=1 Tax=Oceanicoccus sp. KOV_DT_Chl TaxID=1904639 RepID=UPI000C7BD6F5|nr:hypothetical protein [Oceanicoccus sp. KOV_DT_Chl]